MDQSTLRKLFGAKDNFGAGTCQFVSWGGFRQNLQKEITEKFFRVCLCGHKELLEKVFTHHDQLPEVIRLALPLKQVWRVAAQAMD